MAILPVHQMIQHPDILGNFRQGVAFGQQQQERQETRADQQQLRKLAAGIQQGDPAAYSQAAAIDPAAAGKQLMAGDAMARRAEGLIKMMEDADATNPQQAQALWQNYGVPFARQFSQGTEPTTDWAQAKPMLASLKARIAMAKAGDEVKGADVKVVGNALVDASGRVLYQGQPDSKYFQTDQGLVEVGPGGAREVRLDGQSAPQGMPGAAAAPASAAPSSGGQLIDTSPQAVQNLIKGLAAQFGGQVTSLQRSPSKNASVDGVPNSQHIPGTAGDVVIHDPRARAAYIAAAQAAGLEVIDEGDHVHAELPPGARRGATAQAAPQGGRPLLPASSIYQRQASERADRAEARAGIPAGWERDGNGVLRPMQGGPAQLAIEARADAAAAKKAAEDAKALQKQQGADARQAEAASAASQLVSAIDNLTASAGFDDLGTTWGDLQLNAPLVRNDAKDSNAQLKNIAGQVALATMAKLKALSSSGATGFGSLTKPELTLLENSIATLQSEDISNEQLRKSLKIIRDTMDKTTTWRPNERQAAAGGDMSRPQTQADFDALPSGATYIDPDDGQTYRKP